MAEEVSTGGLVKFRYEKGSQPKLSDERREEIKDAYQIYYERRLREKKKRLMFWIIGLLVFLVLMGIFFFF